MGWSVNPEDREGIPEATAASDRDEAIRWARELIAQGVKVIRLKSAGSKPKSDQLAEQPQPDGE